MAKTPRLNYADASNPGLLSAGAQTVPGVKSFPNGVAFGNETFGAYDEGVWTPSVSALSNVTFTGAHGFSLPLYTRVGNIVFAQIYDINAATYIRIDAAGGYTYIRISTAGLPSLSSIAANGIMGGAGVTRTAAPYTPLPVTLIEQGSTAFDIRIAALANLGVGTNDTIAIRNVFFYYKV